MSEDPPADPSGDRRLPPAVGGPQAVGRAATTPWGRRVVHGSVTVDVADERSGDPRSRGDPAEDLDLPRWGRLAAAAAHDEGVRRPAELGLAFVDEAEIAELAGRWLHSAHATDVLAFPVEASVKGAARGPEAHRPPLLIGDVVVCPSVAARQAGEAGHRVEDELALLVVHGVLHLLGHDHAGRIEARRMDRRTRALLARHHGTPVSTRDRTRVTDRVLRG